MPTPFEQLLQDLRDAAGDTGRLALVTLDFATASDPLLAQAALAAAIPNWFEAPILAALLPEHAADAPTLVEKLRALPMVQPYSRTADTPAWSVHEATRLALRDRLLASDPDRFRLLSRRAAAAIGTPDPDAPDFSLTCEHLYHLLAGQTDEGDAAVATVTGSWHGGNRTERLQTLARLLDELLAARPAPPLLPRGQGLAYLSIAAARENHQPIPLTHALVVQAEAIFRSLAASDPDNAGWQRDLSVSLNKLGNLAVARGDLAGALRWFTESKAIAERLAASDPDNAGWQRDLAVSQIKLGDLAVAQGDLAGALRWFTECKAIAERLAASDPDNAGWQRDLSVSLNKLGNLAVARGDLAGALRWFTESKAIAERLAASDPDNAGWQRDLAVSLEKLGDLAVAQGDLAGALRWFTGGKAIAERLAASDPANAGWQRDLFYSCWVIAIKVFVPQERWVEALALMEQSLAISERLAASDPTNVIWRQDARASRAQVAWLREKAGR